jgi:acyl-[acyl-carrier-protein]-phospholipid O-acyltransferase/long-chain-fatty-acid--[acyl-carrier-protein] ligase
MEARRLATAYRLAELDDCGTLAITSFKVEEKLHELAGSTEQTFVVAGVPDEKRGERLVVLHRLNEESLKACLEKLNRSDLPNLWKPRPDQFFHVEKFGYLGSGKLDLSASRLLAIHLSAEKKEVAPA